MKYILKTFFVIIALFSALNIDAKVTKLLAIGNSFSVDAVEQNLWNLANADGEEMIIGNMYIPGCSIGQHVGCINKNSNRYSYRKIGLDGKKREIKRQTIEKALLDEDWDIITVQQVSDMSGNYSTYSKLSDLIKYIREHVSPNAKIIFHQTWAYHKQSRHPGFPYYQKSQTLMYNAIINTTKQMMKEYKLEGLIPAGTAVQIARSTDMGDTMTRDGYHLSSTGRYTVACTWYEYLFNKNVIGNTYAPSSITQKEKELSQQSAHRANTLSYSAF